jgi:hypothetical protein
MIEQLIAFSIRKKYIVLSITLVISMFGFYSAANLSVDAVPDVTNVQVSAPHFLHGVIFVSLMIRFHFRHWITFWTVALRTLSSRKEMCFA